MYRRCATEISARHQKQVEEALLELMEKPSFEDITVTELCQAAGVSRRVFYHLFSNKAGALHALIDHRILALESFHPEIRDDVLRFFTYWREQKGFLDALWANDLIGILQERLIITVLDESRDLQYQLRRSGWSLEKEVLIYHLSGLMGITCSWYRSGYSRTAEDMTALVNRMMTHALAEEDSGK